MDEEVEKKYQVCPRCGADKFMEWTSEVCRQDGVRIFTGTGSGIMMMPEALNYRGLRKE